MNTHLPLLRRFALVTVFFATVFMGGCGGGPTLAPVSGVVTLDGKPYPNAVVNFQPVATNGIDAPGLGSMAITDENGKFTLKYDNVKPGAVVGKHVIRIVTNGVFTAPQNEEGTGSDDELPKEAKVDPIPPEWFDPNNPKHFDVPAGGTDQANFAITSKKAKKK